MLVVAGSPGLTGAAALAARATLRAGAGLTVVAVPAAVQPAVAAHLLEVMCAPLPDRGRPPRPGVGGAGAGAGGAGGAVASARASGRAEARPRRSCSSSTAWRCPPVLDADGLWHLGDAPERWPGARRRPSSPPTPARRRACWAARAHEVEAGRLDAARELAERSGAVVVLKGAGHAHGRPRRRRRS